MKKVVLTKIIAIIAIMLMTVNSSLLTVISAAVDETKELTDESKAEVKNEINLEKYVNYSVKNQKGVLIKYDLKTGVEYKEDQEYVALKETKTELVAPQINNEYPERVEVEAISTKATNGSDTAKDWESDYDSKTGKIVISSSNKEDENNNIYTDKVDGARDNYKIILYYSSNCYAENNLVRALELKGNTVLTLNTNDSKKISGDIDIKNDVTENISGLISADVNASEIYNGNIYANANLGTTNSTKYSENLNLNIDNIIDSNIIQISEDDKFVDKENKEIDTKEIKYESIKLNKNNIIDILGEDGKLTILNDSNEILLEINKDSETNEDGTITKDFENEQDSLKVEFTKPVKIGTIKIENTKKIKESFKNLDLNTIRVQTEVKVLENSEEKKNENTNNENIKKETKEIYNYKNNYDMSIQEAQTKIELDTDNKEWTNNAINDVNFTLKLNTNDPKYNLFKNSTIEITLPEDVDKVILGTSSLLYADNELTGNVELVENGNNKVIRVTLNGQQSNYTTDSIYEGPYVVIAAKISLKEELTTETSNIGITYTNENGKEIDYIQNGAQNKTYEIKEKNERQISSLSDAQYVRKMDAPSVNAENQTTEDAKVIEEGLTTILTAQVGNKVLKDGDTVYEKQIITYMAKITNNTGKDIKNLKMKGTVPENTTYVTVSKHEITAASESEEVQYQYDEDPNTKEVTQTIDQIKNGETITKFYDVQVNTLKSSDSAINIKSDVSLYDGDKEIDKLTLQNNVKTAQIYARELCTMNDEYDNQWEYILMIKNTTSKDITNVTVKINIPEEMEIIRKGAVADEQDVKTLSENIADGYYTIKIDRVQAGKEVDILSFMKPKTLNAGQYSYDLFVAAEISADDIETYNTNLNYENMVTRGLEVSMTSESEGKEINDGEEVEYNVKVKLNGNSTLHKDLTVNMSDYLPDELIPEKVEYNDWEYNEETQKYVSVEKTEDISSKQIDEDAEDTENDSAPSFNIYVTIPNNEEVNFKIKVRADQIAKTKEVSNCVSVSDVDDNTVTSNFIKFTILGTKEKEEPEDPDNPDNPDNPNKPTNDSYSISGQVWLDENNDGQRDESEQKIPGVKVKLFDISTNKIVTDKDGNKYTKTTGEDGKYEFTDVAKGKYIVLFEYDNTIYEVTSYKKDGISEELNSDAINKEVAIDGTEENAGVTDTITISSSDIQNIDLGLIKSEKLDLKLDKYVSKITVTNSKGTKEYNYNDKKLAKIEIPSKETANSTIEITYKIVVTNEGEKSAYVSEVTDYLPQDLTFDTTSSKGRQQTNGDIKINSLGGKLLRAGESEEIGFVAIANATGTYVNAAEITTFKNDSSIKDIDSTEGNKDSKEDDYSEATVIVAVKTGAIVGVSIGTIIVALVVLLVILSKKNGNGKINHKKHNNWFKKASKFMSKTFVFLFTIGIITALAIASQTTSEAADSRLTKEYKSKTDLSNAFVTSSEVDLNYSSSNFSHNWDKYDITNKNIFRCNTPSLAMCGSGHHYFRQSGKPTVTEWKVTTNSNKKKNTYNVTPSEKVDGKILDDDYYIYGPYNISKKSGDGKDQKIKSVNLYNEDESRVSEGEKWAICDKHGNKKDIELGTDFYVKVKKSTDPRYAKIKITYELDDSSTVNWKLTENWHCFDCEGNHTHKCRTINGTQRVVRKWEGSFKTSSKQETEVKIKFKAPANGKYSLYIIKEDVRGQKIYDGTATFQVNDTTESIRGYKIVRDKKINDSNVDKDDVYTITETKAPDGYTKYDGKIKLTVKKTMENGKYKVKSIECTAEGENVVNGSGQVRATLSGNKVKIYVKNTKPDGGYYLTLVKRDKEGKEIEDKQATFIVNGETKYVSGTETVVDGKKITEADVNKDDIYTITEDFAPEGYKKFEGTITVDVSKQKTADGKYEIKSVTPTVTGGDTSLINIRYNKEIATIFVYVRNTDEDEDQPDKVNISLKKVDSRSEAPLNNVGFKIRAQILTYVPEYTSNEYHSIPCTHDSDNDGVPDHSDDGFYWTQFHYKQVERTYYIDNNNQWSDVGEDGAKTFYTDQNGKIAISNIQFKQNTLKNQYATDSGPKDEYKYDSYSNGGQVTAIEIYNPYYGYNEVDPDSTSVRYEYKLDDYQDEPIKNKQYKIKLSGYVWLEDYTGKTSVTDAKCDGTESGINGITVKLIRNGNVEQQMKTTNQLSIYNVEGGQYRFENIDLDAVLDGEYHIEFEYCGIDYQAVTPNLTIDNGSKAADTSTRSDLDASFSRVDGNGSQSLNMGDVTLNYDPISNYASTMEEHINGYDRGHTYRQNIDDHDGCTVVASTEEANYNLGSNVHTPQEEIKNINLGLFKKQQTDYALVKDLDNVNVKVNGRNHVYKYATKRYNDDDSTKADTFNVGVKFQKSNGNFGNYQRPIYTSDANTNGDRSDVSAENKLQVYLTYKIAIRNEQSYKAIINNIVDYSDQGMELQRAALEINNNKVTDEKTRQISNANITQFSKQGNVSGYDKYLINLGEVNNTNTPLEDGKEEVLYLEFKVTDNTAKTLIGSGDSGVTLKNNVAEINSYTTLSDDNKPVAVYDMDSVPGTTAPGEVDSYEDDTDAAPTFQMKLAGARYIEGTVFEDIANIIDNQNRTVANNKTDKSTIYENHERQGNGEFEQGETTIKDVKVELRDLENNDHLAKLYTNMDGTPDTTKSTVITGADGHYRFDGFLPGRYEVVFTWGDKTYRVQYYKGTVYDQNRLGIDENNNSTKMGAEKSTVDEYTGKKEFWYRGSEYGNDTISSEKRATDAIDNLATRKSIDAQMTDYDNAAHKNNNTNPGINNLEDRINDCYAENNNDFIKQMDSHTPAFEIGENYTTTITQVPDNGVDEVKIKFATMDFGITQRPLQRMEIAKTVKGFKLVLANGQVLVDANYNANTGKFEGTQQYTSFLNINPTPSFSPLGVIKTEMDNELIEGATIEVTYQITVTNTGEIDYTSDNYYKFRNSNGAKLVKISPSQILDYVDGKVSVGDNANLTIGSQTTQWTIVEDENYKTNYNIAKKDDTAYLNKIKQYVTTTLSSTYLPPRGSVEGRGTPASGQASVYMKTSKLLSSTEDNEFNNAVETTEMKKKKDEGEITGTPAKISTDGSGLKYFNVSSAPPIEILPSTGGNKNYVMPITITISAIAVLGVGIFLIKKYVIGSKK